MLSAALTVQVWRGCSVVLAVGLHGLYITMVDGGVVVNVMYVVPRITSTTSAEHGGHRHWHGCVSTGIKYSVWYHTFCMTYLWQTSYLFQILSRVCSAVCSSLAPAATYHYRA